jgi:hypothetical protein
MRINACRRGFFKLVNSSSSAGGHAMGPDRHESLRTQIAHQVEVVAELICEGRSAIEAGLWLDYLSRRLAFEEDGRGKKASDLRPWKDGC